MRDVEERVIDSANREIFRFPAGHPRGLGEHGFDVVAVGDDLPAIRHNELAQVLGLDLRIVQHPQRILLLLAFFGREGMYFDFRTSYFRG
jgi:hypothetical protein